MRSVLLRATGLRMTSPTRVARRSRVAGDAQEPTWWRLCGGARVTSCSSNGARLDRVVFYYFLSRVVQRRVDQERLQ
jgi:hypothetical protein